MGPYEVIFDYKMKFEYWSGEELFGGGVPSRARVWEQMAPSVLPALWVNSGLRRVVPCAKYQMWECFPIQAFVNTKLPSAKLSPFSSFEGSLICSTVITPIVKL